MDTQTDVQAHSTDELRVEIAATLERIDARLASMESRLVDRQSAGELARRAADSDVVRASTSRHMQQVREVANEYGIREWSVLVAWLRYPGDSFDEFCQKMLHVARTLRADEPTE